MRNFSFAASARAQNFVRRMRLLSLVGIFCVVAAACGGGGGSTSPTPTPTPPPPVTSVDPLAPLGLLDMGTTIAQYQIEAAGVGGDGDGGVGGGAGDGAPIKFATVTLTDANGLQVKGLTGSNGRFLLKFDTQRFKPPFVLRVVDSAGKLLSSVTTEAVPSGKAAWAQVNPLTDKIASDSLPSSVGGTDKLLNGSNVDLNSFALAKSNMVSSIQAALAATGIADTSKFDPVRSTYAYDGNGVDAVIDSVGHARDERTGATQLRVKLQSVQNGAPALVGTGSPLPASLLATPGSKNLTFDKLDAWIKEKNRCLALSLAARTADADCADADGSRLVSKTYLNSGQDFPRNFDRLFSNRDGSEVTGSAFLNPTVLYIDKFTGSTAPYDDMAVVEFTVRQPFIGPLVDGGVPFAVEYKKIGVFRRDDTLTSRAKAGNWILHGNQRRFNLELSTDYSQIVQVNPAPSSNLGQYRTGLNIGAKTYVVNASGSKIDANMRAVRVTGPGLPTAGIVLAPTLTSGTDFSMAILNRTGTVPITSTPVVSPGNIFYLAVVDANGNPLATNPFTLFDSSNVAVNVTDVSGFSPIPVYAKYQFEIFLNSNTSGVADFVESTRNTSSVTSPASLKNAQWHDLSKSKPQVSPPGNATAATTLNVQWDNNLLAGSVVRVYGYGGSTNPFSNVYGTNSLGTLVTSQTVTASTPNGFSAVRAPAFLFPNDFRSVTVSTYQARAQYSTEMWWNN